MSKFQQNEHTPVDQLQAFLHHLPKPLSTLSPVGHRMGPTIGPAVCLIGFESDWLGLPTTVKGIYRGIQYSSLHIVPMFFQPLEELTGFKHQH